MNDEMEKTKISVEKTSDYRDLFPIFLAGFVLLGSEVLLSQTVWECFPDILPACLVFCLGDCAHRLRGLYLLVEKPAE